MDTPVELNRWLNENNPPSGLQYAKGWWDYIEVVRRLAIKFEIDEVAVIGTYRMNTPPPEEVLTMPVFRLQARGFELIAKWDFRDRPGSVDYQPDSSRFCGARHVRPLQRIGRASARGGAGSASGMELPSVPESPDRFSCELEDEWDLAAFVRIMMGPASGLFLNSDQESWSRVRAQSASNRARSRK